MLKKFLSELRQQYLGALALSLVLSGGTAYAAATITGDDVVNESLTGGDVRGTDGTSSTRGLNGSLTGADIAGQPAITASGQPRIEGSLTGSDIKDNSLTGNDVNELTLTRGLGIHKLIGRFGPLPIEAKFKTDGGRILVSASGSGFRTTNTTGRIGMNLQVFGSGLSSAKVIPMYANELDSHKAFVTGLAAYDTPPGEYTLRLLPLRDNACDTASETANNYCTSTDFNDFFEASVVELPD